MKMILVGSGKMLYFLCRYFMDSGNEVIIINRNAEECAQFARQLSVTVVIGDGSDTENLKKAGAMEAGTVIAITPNDQDNLVICQLASFEFGVPKTIALANDPDNADVFEKLGISAFSIIPVFATLIEQSSFTEQFVNLLPVGKDRIMVTEIVLDDDSPVAGKLLKDIELPENALISVMIRNNQLIVPRGANDLLPGDRVVVMTMPENHGRVLEILTGGS
jgi:trk system potassium uptake protein TrkA